MVWVGVEGGLLRGSARNEPMLKGHSASPRHVLEDTAATPLESSENGLAGGASVAHFGESSTVPGIPIEAVRRFRSNVSERCHQNGEWHATPFTKVEKLRRHNMSISLSKTDGYRVRFERKYIRIPRDVLHEIPKTSTLGGDCI